MLLAPKLWIRGRNNRFWFFFGAQEDTGRVIPHPWRGLRLFEKEFSAVVDFVDCVPIQITLPLSNLPIRERTTKRRQRWPGNLGSREPQFDSRHTARNAGHLEFTWKPSSVH